MTTMPLKRIFGPDEWDATDLWLDGMATSGNPAVAVSEFMASTFGCSSIEEAVEPTVRIQPNDSVSDRQAVRLKAPTCPQELLVLCSELNRSCREVQRRCREERTGSVGIRFASDPGIIRYAQLAWRKQRSKPAVRSDTDGHQLGKFVSNCIDR